MIIGSNSTLNAGGLNGAFGGGQSSAGGISGGFTGGSGSGGGTNYAGLAQLGAQVASAASSGTKPSKFGSSLSMAATGASMGSAAGPWGMAAGAVIGAIAGIFSGGGGDPDHERPDLIKIAKANDITEQQASDVCGYEEQHVSDNYDDICSRAANDNSYFLSLLTKYNSAKPNSQIRTKAAVATEAAAPQYLALQQNAAQMFAGTGKASPFENMSFSTAQMNAAAQNMSISDYLTAILNGALAGAQQGAAGAAANTPAGQAATNDTISYLAKKYQLALAAAGLGLIWLGKEAYENNSK